MIQVTEQFIVNYLYLSMLVYKQTKNGIQVQVYFCFHLTFNNLQVQIKVGNV